METMNEKKNFIFNLLLITIFFNIWFPKAGIKIGNMPITVGSVLLGITFSLWIIRKLKYKNLKFTKLHFLLTISILYYFFRFVIAGHYIEEFRFLMVLSVYPIIFFLTFDLIDSKEKVNKILKLILYGFIFLTIYSIIQYIFGIATVDIPGLTVNLSDYLTYGDRWFMTKANGINVDNAKIVSTYQNGNLFGVNLLLIYPVIYTYLKDKDSKLLNISFLLFVISIFLCLSRTCWVGLVLFVFFGIFLVNEKTKKSVVRKFLILILCLILVFIIFTYFPSVIKRFTDTDVSDWISMSGRTEGMINLFKSTYSSGKLIPWILGPQYFINYRGFAYEMTPLSIFVHTGVIGVVLFYLFIFNILKILNTKNALEKSVCLSIFLWVLYGCIEGGFWLPPTAINFYFIIGFGIAMYNINTKEVKND